jgi:LPS sulfotransferase NodH
MRLSRPFHRLAVTFDTERLASEVAQIPASAWVQHPNGLTGNSAVRLISLGGGENDDVNGRMSMTPHLRQSSYLRQVLGSFGTVWGRSRLMRLAPGASVPPHADLNYHWFSRVRLHIPIITRPGVIFHCGDESVHMRSGEAWLFDNWRQHRVENPTELERIHLVADTSGSSSFWQFVGRSLTPETAAALVPYVAGREVTPLTEQMELPPVMPPAEVELLIMDLRSELVAQSDARNARSLLSRYHALLDGLCKDWRQIYSLHGESDAGRQDFITLRDSVRVASKQLTADIVMRTNRVNAHNVLDARVLRPMVVPARLVRRPVFIVAAPRSGSSLLFETLAASGQLSNLGGEAHWMVESMQSLQPGAPEVESNRLTAANLTSDAGVQIVKFIGEKLVGSLGQSTPLSTATRLLEKTPKNALRIPFFNALFPDAQFIFLWREPRGNISSMIEAWRSGKWKTYNGLDGFDGPWSLILPPHWQTMNGRPVEDIAAFQWASTNDIVLNDLATLPAERWTHVNYDDLVGDPNATVERLCRFMNIEMDEGLQRRLGSPQPYSQYTDTPPQPNKWQKNAALVERVIPEVEAVWQRLQSLDQSAQGSPKR